LRAGDCVLIYPEGDVKINADASPREWRPGAAGLARSGNVTVLPIAHHDSRVLGSNGVMGSVARALLSFVHRPKIRLRIGEAIGPERISQGSVQDAGTMLSARLLETWREAAQA
jgi:1-acyl-sn-glycerol-3-phosphate acyltransferase